MHEKISKRILFAFAGLIISIVVCVVGFNVARYFILKSNEALVASVAQSLMPVLLSNDTLQVEAVMKALAQHPGIEAAELLAADGASVASYVKDGHVSDPMLTQFELASASDDASHQHVMAPITFDSLNVATLYLTVNLWSAYLRILTWLGIFLIAATTMYVFVKQSQIKLRFETLHDDDELPDLPGPPFDLEQVLRVEMSDADISLEYQPIQRMADGGLFGMEVLVCWRHPSGQTFYVTPSDFVQLAEINNICLPFDEWLLRAACTQAGVWQHQYGPLILSVNISAAQFRDPAFARKIRELCVQTQYPHQLLELEVNESVMTPDLAKAAAYVQSFANQGLSVTVNRFGLTRSSLDLLASLPEQKVKLDKKLVKRLGKDAQVERWVSETVARALSRDVQVMVDGVEMGTQRMLLQRMGCILGQGSYFCPPMKASAFETFLAARPLGADQKVPMMDWCNSDVTSGRTPNQA
jgi:EAL domain-containing protein (putative c-di-GMP-specific phosphodiesterase class I)